MRKRSCFGRDLVRVKAEALCYGVRPNETVFGIDAFFNESGFVHGSQLILEDGSTVNVPVSEKFVLEYSPFYLKQSGSEYVLYRENEPQCMCKPLEMPIWVHARISDDVFVSDIVRPHNRNTLFCVPVKRCAFDLIGRKCLFCTFDGHPSCHSLENVRKALRIALGSGDFKAVAIGGATPNLADLGVRYYSRILKIVKEMGDFETSLELVPPRDPSDLELLSRAGADSVILNLEVYDENIRRKICPGKGLIRRETYFESWRRAVEVFGRGQASSVLIVGLEPRSSIVEGCTKMTDIGVVPTLIPFRPYDSCALSCLMPTDAEYYLAVSKEISLMANAKGLDPLDQPGCTRCGGCSMESMLSFEVP